MDRVSILLPTAGKRMQGLLYQVAACLNQSYPAITLYVLVDAEPIYFKQIEYRVGVQHDNRAEVIQVPKEYSGKHGHGPIRYAVENLNLDEWCLTTGDDDAIMPWAVEKLIEGALPRMDMVIGKCLPVKRNGDAVRQMLGDTLRQDMITGSCCLYRSSRLKEVGYDDSRYQADWDAIEKMMKFPFNIIETVLFVMPQEYK